ncbi:enhancer of mRNA-decapping protein 4 [Elysia marginata]|uniref:Enhancer of mRNA-decapping protein 4 n=1 Tax=Elysia marginata TaxID=1093978 RepID=A0AAV4J1V3_9GAST|nr:enhancer of mRNA-decapping protein 4 [Elysia marginata]
MESDDGESFGTASSDTSMFLRELQALNATSVGADSSRSTVPNLAEQSLATSTIEVTGSGDASDSQTLPLALKTMIGSRPKQIINLEETVEDSASVYSPEVEIHVAATDNTSMSAGSNKVKIIPVVNHQWELKYYYGNLVAVHRDSDFMAYALRGKTMFNVRVLSRKTAQRTLLKSFKGQVMDIAFALSDDVYLAAVDESGTFFVYSFVMEDESIITNLVLHIEKEKASTGADFRNLTRVIWCPYIPEDDVDSGAADPAKMLVLLHGTQAEVWNVDIVSGQKHENPLKSEYVEYGMMLFESHDPSVPLVNAAFAPDGSAIALAYYSGIVRFFLVGLEDSKTECMYEWYPHDGNPVTSLFFLDDHKHQMADLQLWKFALTGANHNTEIKLWSCETWACVQKLNFLSPIKQPDLKLQFKSEIDLSSRYLALSDINSKVLYVLQIHQNYSSSTAHVSSVSQFMLTQPCLSFAIFDAGVKRFRHSDNDSHLDEITTGELEDQPNDEDEQVDKTAMDSDFTSGVQLKMYGVHVKSLQELLIRYRPETSVPDVTSASSMSQEDTGAIRDMLSDVSMDQSEASQDLILPVHSSASPAKPLVVPSPSDGKAATVQEEDSHVSLSSTSSFTEVTAMNDDGLLMDSPRGSMAPSSVLSPSSAFAKTPSQADSSPGITTPAVNLSNIPLPPVVSKEDMTVLEGNNEALKSSSSPLATRSQDAIQVSDPQDASLINQPVVDQSGSLSSSTNSRKLQLEELFMGAQSAIASLEEKSVGDSLESASSTRSFPIGKSVSLKAVEEKYDENDQEVAEALGLEDEMEDLNGTNEGNEEQQKIQELGEERSGVVWPDPPDVSAQAKRLVDEALEQGAEEEDGDKDFDEDENDDGEVEEIIQLSMEATEEVNNSDAEGGYSERPHRPNPEPSHHIKALQNIDVKVSSLFEKLRQQQEMMLKMQEELAHQRDLQTQLRRHQVEQQQLQEAIEAQQSSTSTVEQDIYKSLPNVYTRRMNERADPRNALHRSDVQRKQRDETLQRAVINEVALSVKNTLASTLRTEIKQTVNPALYQFVEPLKDKIHQEVAHRLTACDTLLKDNISKAVKSRSTMDMLATSIGDVIYQHMQQAYTDSFRTAMLPSYKEALEKSVRDVHGIFQQGTKEYQLYMRQTADQMLKERNAIDELVSRMEVAEKKFVQNAAQIKTLIIASVKEELGGQVAQAVSSVKSEIVCDVKRLLREEMGQALQEHGANISDQLSTYLRSGAGTPVPFTSEEETSKDRILRELRSGRINEAFQSALSVGNIDMVVFACDSARPMDIFAQNPFPLTQPVLLSLISQLSANLDKDFDLKIKYLEDAVMFLDPSQPTSSEHIPNVVGGLVSSLQSCDAHGGDPRKLKTIRMLIMAGKSLLT